MHIKYFFNKQSNQINKQTRQLKPASPLKKQTSAENTEQSHQAATNLCPPLSGNLNSKETNDNINKTLTRKFAPQLLK